MRRKYNIRLPSILFIILLLVTTTRAALAQATDASKVNNPAAAAASQDPTLAKLHNPTLTVAGHKAFVGVPGVVVRDGTLLIPIRPVAEALLSEVVIDSNTRTISIIRADDQAQVFYDAVKNVLKIQNSYAGQIEDRNLIDWTPGEEAVPQDLLQVMLDVYVHVDANANVVAVNPNSAAFAEALGEYLEEREKEPPPKKFELPTLRLTDIGYNNTIDDNTVTKTGQVTFSNFSASYGQTLINGYISYLGSKFGPGWLYSMGGINVIRPNQFNFQAGTYALRTGGLFANGLENGFVLEKIKGKNTKIGVQIGKLQSSAQFVGIQTQRPLFARKDVLAYFSIDSRDFKPTAPLFKDNVMKAGGGVGAFQDDRTIPAALVGPSAPTSQLRTGPPSFTPQEGVVGYVFARDDIKRFSGNLWVISSFDAGVSEINNNTTIPDNLFHGGSIFVVKNATTLFKRLTISTLVQRGSPNWTTMDISQLYKNLFLYNQGANLIVIPGISLFAQRSFEQSTQDLLAHPWTHVYTGGISFNKYAQYLPTVAFSTNIITTQSQPGTSTFFDTLSWQQNFGFLRTKMNGEFLLSNQNSVAAANANAVAGNPLAIAPVTSTATTSGTTTTPVSLSTSSTSSSINSGLQYTVMITTSTQLWRDFYVNYMQQWSNPQVVINQLTLSTGRLLGDKLQGFWGIGKVLSPVTATTQNNLFAGLSILVPGISQHVNCYINKTVTTTEGPSSSKNTFFQAIVNLSAYVGRGKNLSGVNLPTAASRPTGTLSGRFYVDVDLDGHYTPGVDIPLPHMMIISSNVVLGKTDLEGQYTFKGVKPGFVSVTTDLKSVPAQYAFLENTERATFILPNHTRTIDFRFGKYGHISGVVKAQGPVPADELKDIRVFVAGTDRDSLTDEDGSFTISDIAPGKYIVKIDPDYVVPDLEIVNGEVAVDLKPAVKATGITFYVKHKVKPVEEKHFEEKHF